MINHNSTEEVQTERLILRKFRFNDMVSMLRNWIADPVVQHKYGEPIYEGEEAVKELLSNWAVLYKNKDFYRWAIILKASGECIGQIAFCRVYIESRTAEVEYCIGQNFWGNDYTSEALKMVLLYSFRILGFNKIEGFHLVNNPNSGRVLQKSGMKRTASITRFDQLMEQRDGNICYAITKEQFLNKWGRLEKVFIRES